MGRPVKFVVGAALIVSAFIPGVNAITIPLLGASLSKGFLFAGAAALRYAFAPGRLANVQGDYVRPSGRPLALVRLDP